jgi:undecaprenyl pyrophosphate synthase
LNLEIRPAGQQKIDNFLLIQMYKDILTTKCSLKQLKLKRSTPMVLCNGPKESGFL